MIITYYNGCILIMHLGSGGQAGSAGYLDVEFFILGPCPSFMKKTLPDSNNKISLNFGGTYIIYYTVLFSQTKILHIIVILDTYSNENGDITTRSDNAPEDIAAILSLMNIFNLCNPDKVS